MKISRKMCIRDRVNAEKGEVSVYNENFFRNLSNYALAWSLIEDGVETQNGTIADAVAAGMKLWAEENGVTHYTHWFQPLTEEMCIRDR